MSATGLSFSGAPPEQIRAIESLGSFVVVRINPAVASVAAGTSACAVVQGGMRASLAGRMVSFRIPYPVTPFHGDYLHHADLAAAAKARFAEAAPPSHAAGSRRTAASRSIHPDWSARGTDWDIEVVEVDAAEQMRIGDVVRERPARVRPG